PSAVVVGEVSLRPGERTTLAGEVLTIELVSVSNDSRCPIDAACIRQGNAEVTVKLTQDGRPASFLRLHTAAAPGRGKMEHPNEANYLNYTIRLTDLQPSPKAGAAIPQKSYVATFIVSKEIR
ncbi:MAG TPA: hypothetical protein VFA47_02080, partial [Candidatus Manganitrophaceae bacterium]|nr:hypothetical protein [Candidatus Manganitrophaceae bacterium]